MLTAPDIDNYAFAKGLLAARHIAQNNSDSTFTDQGEHVIDTVLNVAVGPGCTIQRAIEVYWAGAILVTAATPFRVVTRAYYQAGSTFSLGSATNIGSATGQHNTSIDWVTNQWTQSLAPGTYSFGITIQVPVAGFTSWTIKLDSGNNYLRWLSVTDLGEGALITS